MASIMALVPSSVSSCRPLLSSRSFLVRLTAAMKRLGSFDPDADGAVHGDGLQVLGPHHRADARTARRPVQVVDHAGIAHALLAGDADGGHLEERVLMLGLDPALGMPDGGAPELVSRQDLHHIIDDMKVNRAPPPCLPGSADRNRRISDRRQTCRRNWNRR